jgi:photosystem II stability/assembly factor-like uncharacterized protein
VLPQRRVEDMGWLKLKARRARSRLSSGPIHSPRKRTVALSALILGIIALASPLSPLVSTTSSWAATPTVAPAIEDVACANASQCVAVGGLVGSVLISTDAGTTWSRVSVPTHHYLYGVACPTASRCVAVGDAGVALFTGNGGRRWSAAATGVSVPLSGVSCPTAQQCTAVGDHETVLDSSDGGSSWSQRFSQLGVMDDVSCGSPAHCSAVTSNADQTLTTTDGSTWKPTPEPFTNFAATLFPANGISCVQQRCVEVGDYGSIAESDDAGASWTAATTGTTNVYDVTCVSTAECVAVGAAGTVLRTTDGGATWISEVPPTGENLLGVSCPVANGCVAVGSGGTMLTSSDGGATWTVRAGTPAPAQQLKVLVVGDSFSGTLAEGIARNSPAYGVTIINRSVDGCALAIGPYLLNGEPSPHPGLCATTPGWVPHYEAAIAAFHPVLSVLVLGPWDLNTRFINGKYQSPGRSAYDAYFRQQVAMALQILTAGGGRVVITTAPYIRQNGPEYCAPKPARNPGCPSQKQRVAALDNAARQAAAGYPGRATLIDLGRKLSPHDTFASSVDGVVVRAADGVHLTTPGDEWMAPWLLPQLVLAAQTSGASATSP